MGNRFLLHRRVDNDPLELGWTYRLGLHGGVDGCLEQCFYPGFANRRTFAGPTTYKRHGTINLFAALEVATGTIRGKTTQTKKRANFQAFMDEIIADQPLERQIHVILDNLSTHKKNDKWLAAHPNVAFHFTPTSASWLNQVEIWFGIFQRKTLRNASFSSINQLIQAIDSFTTTYNKNASPFVWRKREVKGAQLRNTIVNLRN
jgi:transposase